MWAVVSAPTHPGAPPPQPAREPPPEPDARPPSFAGYRPPRTTAVGGLTMLISTLFAAGAVVALVLAGASKVWDLRTFGQISNLIAFAIALMLLALWLLLWEITLRVIEHSGE